MYPQIRVKLHEDNQHIEVLAHVAGPEYTRLRFTLAETLRLADALKRIVYSVHSEEAVSHEWWDDDIPQAEITFGTCK